MKTAIFLLMLCISVFMGGCATTNSIPANTAAATEQGGSWSDVRAVITAVNLGDVARLGANVPGESNDGNGGVSLGKDTSTVVTDALASGRPVVVYLENLTINQSITTGAKATRSGTTDQAAAATTEQTPTNSPTTDVAVEIPLLP